MTFVLGSSFVVLVPAIAIALFIYLFLALVDVPDASHDLVVR